MRKLKRFLRHPQNLLGLLLAFSFIYIALDAPRLAPPVESDAPGALPGFSPYRKVPNLNSYDPIPPGPQALLGTMALGRIGTQLDIYYTLVWGTREALKFGLTVAFATALLGIVIGGASAYFGGWVNQLSLRITDAFLAFPIVAAVVFFQQLIRASNPLAWLSLNATIDSPLIRLFNAIDPFTLAVVLFSWMPYARITNSMVMRIKGFEYLQAARALGAGHWRMVFRHILPNSISPAIVLVARDIGSMVLLQATLTFIGVSGGSYWGDLLVQGRNWIMGSGGNPFIYWWVFVPATLALVLFGITWNLLGDGLNDWLNPRNS